MGNPGRGGYQPGGGRPKGSTNKSTQELRDLCRKHAPEAIKSLLHLAANAVSEQAKIAAIKEILDRGYGKSTTIIGGEDGAKPELVVSVIGGFPERD